MNKSFTLCMSAMLTTAALAVATQHTPIGASPSAKVPAGSAVQHCSKAGTLTSTQRDNALIPSADTHPQHSVAQTPSRVGIGGEQGTEYLYTVPFTEDFGTDFYRYDYLNYYTIIDGNGDNNGWQYNSYTEVMRCRTMGNTEAADDWLVLPPLTLEAGKAYQLSCFLKDGGASLQESFEVKMGTKPTVEDLNITLIENQLIQSDVLKEYSAYITPATDGDYYIAFHCTTPTAAYYMYLDDVSVVEKAAAALPQPPTAFSVTPASDGAHSAQIEVTAPTLDISSNPLADIEKLTISRDGKVIHTIQTPTPGGQYSYTDTTPDTGWHTYIAQAWNSCGKGDDVATTVYIGIRPPAPTEWAVARETDTDGEVTMTWAPVTTDETGAPLPAGEVTYTVVRLSGSGDIADILAEEVTDCTATFQALESGEQAFVNFAVFAETEGGRSQGRIAPQIIVGTPLSLPYRESFEYYGLPQSPFAVATVEGYGAWMPMDDDLFPDMSSHDLDTGYVAMAATYEGDAASLTSGKIDLSDATCPVLSFYVYNMAGSWGQDDNEVMVEIGVDGSYTTVYNKPNYQLPCSDHWNLISVPLSDYEGKVIQVRITATCHTAAYTVLDEIEIKPWAPYDMRAVAFTAPQRLIAGQKFTLTAEVENIGLKPASGAAAVLYANGNAYMRQELKDIPSGQSEYVTFRPIINPSFGEKVSLQVKVDLYEDTNSSNDRTTPTTLALEQTLLPAPSALTAVGTPAGAIELSWTPADLSTAVPERITETFESSKEWTSTVEGWRFLDMDDAPINGFDGVNFPGIPEASTQSFWVMDSRLEDLNNTFSAYSGYKYLANMNVVDAATDDWAISPQLCGRAQTLSLMARSYHFYFPETFSILYSTTGSDVKDFTLLQEYYSIPWDWAEYTAQLPEGTKYFAIRSNHADGVMLFVDDVTFTPAGSPQALTLLGYKVYCDGIAMVDTPLQECSYTAGGYNPAAHTYAVTALYDKGESAPTNILTPSAVESVSCSDISIYTQADYICIDGIDAQTVIISGIDGRVIYHATASSPLRVQAPTGVYVVKAGSRVAKVIVK